jgi:hypothetical protein
MSNSLLGISLRATRQVDVNWGIGSNPVMFERRITEGKEVVCGSEVSQKYIMESLAYEL